MRLLLIASVTLAMSTTAFAQYLSGSQIKESLQGRTISGVADGESYSEYLTPNGRISGRSRSGRYTGRWEISGNKICMSYEDGTSDCNKVRLQGNRIIWDDGSTATLSEPAR